MAKCGRPEFGDWRRRASRKRRPSRGAELLILHLLGIGKSELLRDLREPFPEEKRQAWETMLARRAAGEPAQYVTGEQYFYGRRFAVTPAVLIPRPETELLAEAVLEGAARIVAARRARQSEERTEAAENDGARERPSDAELRVLDVGTGSGALAVTLKLERPGWQVTASDLSPEALEVAAGNAAALGARVRFAQGDLLAPFMEGGAHAGERIDILVSNPPYIPSSDLPGLQAEVRDHEPRLALDGGPDGLAPYRRMALQLSGLAELPAMVAWEVGIHQAEQAAALLREVADWDEIRIVRDYGGIDRHVLALRF
ncbi:peptide chain release factor N(5)-glutamine methyltransferase [Cohnella rhizosphaerae]|uniref:Release factor glutamine methyltransferase n=1 Tax=Cohnella rhizosphaerae TaxID=1457232 RepID=A0A9X4QUQ0_9BACL|nr:peptide chain release factor N(5)-glutamine methyltransferase [Cohnella rhizosphaerae]MDG0811739.1 peptide chain release factor N(5)-glutamine methyltransferase [Cohnella rhizosphaerae]